MPGPRKREGISRRAFLTGAATIGTSLAVAGLSGCTPQTATDQKVTTATESDSSLWYGKPLDESSLKISRELETEILICGCGHAGMTAAVAASEQGARTLVIEKSSGPGIYRGGPGIVNSKLQIEAGIYTDPMELSNELVRYASGRCNQSVINLWINEGAECFNWLASLMEAQGVTFVAEPDNGTGRHGSYKAWQTGITYLLPEGMRQENAIMNTLSPLLVATAQNSGAEFMFDTALVQFTKTDSKVDGIIAKINDEYIKIKATKGVLLCTGGYEGSEDLMQKLNPAAASTITTAQFMPQNTGEGMMAGIWAGGVKDENPTCMLFDRGGIAPGSEAGYPLSGQLFWMGSQPFLKVDLLGKRIGNESVPYDSMIASSSVRQGNVWCSIWDANFVQQIASFHTLGCSRIMPSPTPNAFSFGIENIIGMNEGLKQAGVIFECDSLEELADKLEIPRDEFAETVKYYNQLCAKGVDTEFGKEAKDLLPITAPPYSGCRVGSALLCTLDGLAIDENCRILDKDKNAIEGLWGAGNFTGGFFADNYPELVFGVASGRTMTEGRHAVLNMLGIK